MSLLLYAVGALALVLGAITIAFGISIELSFGNSLIVAGTSAAVGGLILIGLGSVASQLQRIAEALGGQMPIRPSRPPEMFEAPGAPRTATARVPFPPKPKSGIPRPPLPGMPPVATRAAEEKRAEDQFTAAPMLPNPDVTPVEVHEEVSLSPVQSSAPRAPAETSEATRPAPPFRFGGVGKRQTEAEPEVDHGWRLPPIPGRPPVSPPTIAEEKPNSPPAPPSTLFDTMWPADESKPIKSAVLGKDEAKVESENAPEAEPKVELEVSFKAEPETEPKAEPKTGPEAGFKVEPETEPKAEPKIEVSPATGPTPEEPTEPAKPEVHETAGEARNVAILKSGVVDGMGYTLYVDGSIEAELPQGTLRFTSINDLREYLEKNGES